MQIFVIENHQVFDMQCIVFVVVNWFPVAVSKNNID